MVYSFYDSMRVRVESIAILAFIMAFIVVGLMTPSVVFAHSDTIEELDDIWDDDDVPVYDVITSGTRSWREGEIPPVNAQVVDRDAMEQRNARNIAEALQSTAGVRVENNCQNCGFTQLRLNGLGGAYTQILIDGLPSFSGLASVYGLEQIPTEILERIEVVKGGASALYGPSAVAGVVNLVTRVPSRNFLSATTSYEHVGMSKPDARMSVDGAMISNNGRVAGHFFATTRGRQALDLTGDGFSELTQLRQLAAGTNLFFAPLERGELRVSFHTLREYRRGGDQIDMPPHRVDVAEELQTERHQIDLRWSHRLSDAMRYNLGYVFAYTDRHSYYGGGGTDEPVLPGQGEPIDDVFRERFEDERIALGGYGRTFNPLHIADAHLDLNFEAAGLQQVTIGTQAHIDRIDDRFLGYDRVIDETYSTIGVYTQHNWIFSEWGESIIGARVDKHNELDDPMISPRGALLIRPNAWLFFRSAYSTGFRAPQVFDEDLHIDTVGGDARLVVNAPDLIAERSQSFAQQIATTFKLSNGQDLRVGVNGYYTRLRNAFVLNSVAGAEISPVHEMIRTNRGTTEVLGTELEAGFYAPLWALRAGWTIENAENDEPDEDFQRTEILRTPTHYGYIDAVANLGYFRIQTGVDITGTMLVPRYDAEGEPLEVNQSPWFFDWSLNVSYMALALEELALEPFWGVRNILDSRQRDFDIGSERDAGYVYGPTMPRTIYVGIRGTL